MKEITYSEMGFYCHAIKKGDFLCKLHESITVPPIKYAYRTSPKGTGSRTSCALRSSLRVSFLLKVFWKILQGASVCFMNVDSLIYLPQFDNCKCQIFAYKILLDSFGRGL